MNEGKRAYNILRGYIGREWDRIKSWERLDALKELNEDVPQTKSSESEGPADKTVVYVPEGTTHEEAARHILGVSDSAGFVEIRKAFERLSKRATPDRYNEGSSERRQAMEITKKIHWAYKVLSENATEAERRFGSLEID